MIKQKAIRICDVCRKELYEDFIQIIDVGEYGRIIKVKYEDEDNEDYEELYEFDDMDFCSPKCFIEEFQKIQFNKNNDEPTTA